MSDASAHAPSPQRGLTLIELLVTLSIMAILLSIGFSGWQWIQREQLRSESKALISRLVELRQLSIATRTNWALCPLGDSTSTCGDDWSRGYRWYRKDGAKSHAAGKHKIEGVTVSWNASGPVITFNWRPSAPFTSYGSFSLCNGSGGNKIVINDAARSYLDQGGASSC